MDARTRCCKQNNEHGLTIPVMVLLILLGIALVLIIVIPGYRNHLKNARMTADKQSVVTARDVSSITYLQDGAAGLKIYYYDEIHHTCRSRDEIGRIEPYGRSSKNLSGETGAVGIPNMGDRGGAQLLAVSVQIGEPVNLRWTGKVWSYLDYYYMIDAERATLTPADYTQMDKTSVRWALSCARKQYEDDFGWVSYEELTQSSSKKPQTDPGIAVYDYDVLRDVVIYDECMSELANAAAVPKNSLYGTCMDIRAYGLSAAGDATGAYLIGGARKDEYLSLIPEMSLESLDEHAESNPEGCIVQVWIHGDTSAALWIEGNHG